MTITHEAFANPQPFPPLICCKERFKVACGDFLACRNVLSGNDLHVKAFAYHRSGVWSE